MSQAYTPGLLVTPRTVWRCRRMLPVDGMVLVQPGDVVQSQQVVAETEMSGDAYPINLARQLGIAASQVPKALAVPIGTQIAAGELLAKHEGFFGWFGKEFAAPVAGVVETASAVTGLVILRGPPRKVQVKAYLAGTVVETLNDEGVVIEAPAAVIQGIFGIGGEAYGPLVMAVKSPDEDLTADLINSSHKDAIVVGGRRITRDAVDQARAVGVSALVSGGIDDQDLREILGYDLGVAVTGNETLGISVIVTEGFGDIAMAQRTFQLLNTLQGQAAAVNGTTQIRAGVLRPEIVVPLRDVPAENTPEGSGGGALEIGVPVRVIREPYFGALGVVSDLPSEPQVLESQSKARVVTVQLSRGDKVIVPRANVERIEGATA